MSKVTSRKNIILILPFKHLYLVYASFIGEKIKAIESHFPATNLILPLVLKRYGYNENRQPFRINKTMYIPPYINVNAFVNSDAADEPPCHCCVDIHYRLKLRSGEDYL